MLEEISSVYQIKIDKLSDSVYSSTSNDLFQERRVLLANLMNSKQIDELSKNEHQKIIITDYKNFKKYQNKFLAINGYQYDKDIIYFLKKINNISDESLINYVIILFHHI